MSQKLDLNTLQELFKKDSVIDEFNLDKESLTISSKFSRWLNLFSLISLDLKTLESEYDCLYRKKHEYYLGNMSDSDRKTLGWEPQGKIIIKADLAIYMNSDVELNVYKKNIEHFKIMKTYCEMVLKQLSSRDFQISNAIKYRIFMNGSG